MPRKELPVPDNAESIVAQEAVGGTKNRDIAAMLGISQRTLERRFGAILTKRRAERRAALARRQTTLALKGNVTMLIWLGKQPVEAGGLGQKDTYQLGVKPNFADMTDAELDAFIAGKTRARRED